MRELSHPLVFLKAKIFPGILVFITGSFAFSLSYFWLSFDYLRGNSCHTTRGVWSAVKTLESVQGKKIQFPEREKFSKFLQVLSQIYLWSTRVTHGLKKMWKILILCWLNPTGNSESGEMMQQEQLLWGNGSSWLEFLCRAIEKRQIIPTLGSELFASCWNPTRANPCWSFRYCSQVFFRFCSWFIYIFLEVSFPDSVKGSPTAF